MRQNKPILFMAAFALICGIGFVGYFNTATAQSPSNEEKEQPAAEILDITIGALREDPAAYDGKTLRLKGIFAGECADCTSFYFKDGVDTVETTIPKGFPSDAEIGSKLEVIGTPWLKNTASSDKPYVKLVAKRVTLVKE